VAAKHGIVGFTKSVALEVAEQGITCNSICPGYVMTPIVEKQIDDQARVHGVARENVIREVILAPQPTKEFVKIEDVAAMALFLASDAAASVTGTSLSIDGGWTAQ
jgi:3-hydroxybutyrate dehydrogenase